MRHVAIVGGAVGAGLLGLLFAPQPLPTPQGPPYQRLPQVPFEQHPNQHFLSKVPQTIGIIGGGTAGLTTAKVLSQQGFQVEILEKGSRAGGVWTDNYQDAGLQGPFPHFHFPDHTFPEGTPMLPKLEVVRAFIDAYVDKFNIGSLVSTNSEVVKVSQSPEGEWTVRLKNGATKRYDFLVLATGQFFKPHIPSFPGLSSFQGTAIHSFDFRNAKELCEGKRVVVIGGGKSAFDVMNTASSSGGQVTAIIRKNIWSLSLDKTILGYPAMAFLTNRLYEIVNPAPEQEKTWNRVLLQPLADIYMKLLSNMLQKGLPEVLLPDTSLRLQRFNNFTTRDPAVVDKVHKGDIKIIKGQVERIVPEGAVVRGKTIPADVLIFATGFERNTLGLSTDDMWLYRGILLPEVLNFAVVGYGSAVFSQLKNSLQAVWVAEVLRGTVRLPGFSAMEEEVHRRKKAVEREYHDFPSSAPYAWPEVTYYRTLLRDMGLQQLRKKSLYHDLIEMPNPEDYKTVITHRV